MWQDLQLETLKMEENFRAAKKHKLCYVPLKARENMRLPKRKLRKQPTEGIIGVQTLLLFERGNTFFLLHIIIKT